ncbi:MAG TPA: hypothetical protein VFG98_09835 [Intrasporangium sp.]|nr:hypothetical protein [Intrasporangium sp.]
MTGSGTDAATTGGPVDPATLRALTRARSLTRELADDLLTHLPDLGDIGTQRELDTWVEQAADTLRALSDALEERLLVVCKPQPGGDPEAHRSATDSRARPTAPGGASGRPRAERP